MASVWDDLFHAVYAPESYRNAFNQISGSQAGRYNSRMSGLSHELLTILLQHFHSGNSIRWRLMIPCPGCL